MQQQRKAKERRPLREAMATPAKPPREPTSMDAPLVGKKIHAT
jgi:hypothetical protein